MCSQALVYEEESKIYCRRLNLKEKHEGKFWIGLAKILAFAYKPFFGGIIRLY